MHGAGGWAVNRWLRVARGVAGTAATWGILWGIAAIVFAIGLEPLGAGRTNTPFGRTLIGVGLFFGFFGAWAGSVFAMLMAASERRRTFAQLSAMRVALWGVAGGVSLPLTIVLSQFDMVRRIGPPDGFISILLFTATLGALSGWGMLAMARRARGGDAPPWLGAGANEFTSRVPDAERAAR
jgi:hypothetical protein